MICPFSRITGQVGSGCKDTCALWRAVDGECVFQTIAQALVAIAHPLLMVKDPFADDDRIVLCPGCGKVKQPDDTWKMPKMGPKKETWRPETCPECFEKEVKHNDEQ